MLLLFDVDGPCSQQGLVDTGDINEITRRLMPRMFNQTVPDLVCPEGQLGRELLLDGFDPDGMIRFPLPPEHSVAGQWGPCVRAAIGEKRSRFPCNVSTVFAFVRERVLVVAWRGLFRYLFVPEELRSAQLVFSGDPYLEPPSGD